MWLMLSRGINACIASLSNAHSVHKKLVLYYRCPHKVIGQLASVGLLGSGSHDSGDIAYDIVCNLMMLFADLLNIDIRYTSRGYGR